MSVDSYGQREYAEIVSRKGSIVVHTSVCLVLTALSSIATLLAVFTAGPGMLLALVILTLISWVAAFAVRN